MQRWNIFDEKLISKNFNAKCEHINNVENIMI